LLLSCKYYFLTNTSPKWQENGYGNKAYDRPTTEVPNDKKYILDDFQRKYKREERHIEQLCVSKKTYTDKNYE
jgi:hypothetical protein